MKDDCMDIQYHLTEGDIVALAEYRLKNVSGWRNPVRVRRFAYFFGFALMALGMWLILNSIELTVSFLTFAIVAFLFYPAFLHWRIRQNISKAYRNEKNRVTLATRTLSVTSEGLNEESAWGEIQLKWDKVDITITPAHVFIAIMGQAPSMVVPRDGISNGDYEEFTSTCQHYKKVGVNKQPHTSENFPLGRILKS